MALDCVLASQRQIYRPVVSDFDQGDGSGVDEPANGESIRVSVFLPCAESAEISFLPCAESAEIAPFLPVRKVRFSFFDP